MKNELLKSLLDSDSNITEEAKQKFVVIFEAAVAEGVKELLSKEVTLLTETSDKKVADAVETALTDMKESFDPFLENEINEWATENKNALEGHLMTETAKDFLESILESASKIGQELSIDPAQVVSKESYDALLEKFNSLEIQLTESASSLTVLTEKTEKQERETIKVEVLEGATDLQKDRITSIAESFTFTDNEDFKKKLTYLKEAVCGTSKSKMNEEDDAEDKKESEKEKAKEDGASVVDEETKDKPASKMDPMVEQVLRFEGKLK